MFISHQLEPYYEKEAYNSNQPPQQDNAPPRGLFHKLVGTRLPWGNVQGLTPANIMEDPTPESMRFWETVEQRKNEAKANGTYTPRPLEHLNLHFKHDHEVIRHAQLPLRSQFWLLLKAGGKWITIIFTPLVLLTHLTMTPPFVSSDLEMTPREMIELYLVFLGIPFICGLLGHIIVNYFPRLWFRAPKGPLWELNRRTGMVTVFDYKNFKKTGVIGERTAPFYEFDAYIMTSPDRQGLPMNGLSLAHRYSNLGMNFNDIIAPDNTVKNPCALWDFLQNFMDISRPLPDVPVHEPHRHLDPVTAEYDRQTGRDPRYWIDMDDETFKAKVHEMLGRIDVIDTFTRPNVMARYVRYAD